MRPIRRRTLGRLRPAARSLATLFLVGVLLPTASTGPVAAATTSAGSWDYHGPSGIFSDFHVEETVSPAVVTGPTATAVAVTWTYILHWVTGAVCDQSGGGKSDAPFLTVELAPVGPNRPPWHNPGGLFLQVDASEHVVLQELCLGGVSIDRTETHTASFTMQVDPAAVPPNCYMALSPYTYLLDVPEGAGSGSFASFSVGGAACHQGPTAVPDEASTHADHPTTLPVLANDLFPSGGGSVVSVTKPGHGTASTDGSTVTYTPDHGFLGDDSFTYTIADALGQVDLTTDVVHVGNRPPVALDDALDITTSAAASLAVLGNDSDPDGDPIHVSGVTNGAHGTVTQAGDTVTYTPGATSSIDGTDTFTYTVSDPYGGTAIGSVHVTLQLNRRPIAVDDLNLSYDIANAGGSQLLDLLANDHDPDPGDTLVIKSVADPPHGTATVSFGHFVLYTPDAGFAGAQDDFDYTIADKAGLTDVGHVSIGVPSYSCATFAAKGQAIGNYGTTFFDYRHSVRACTTHDGGMPALVSGSIDVNGTQGAWLKAYSLLRLIPPLDKLPEITQEVVAQHVTTTRSSSTASATMKFCISVTTILPKKLTGPITTRLERLLEKYVGKKFAKELAKQIIDAAVGGLTDCSRTTMTSTLTPDFARIKVSWSSGITHDVLPHTGVQRVLLLAVPAQIPFGYVGNGAGSAICQSPGLLEPVPMNNWTCSPN